MYSRKQCFERALDLTEKYATAWAHLGMVGGGEVHGKAYSKEQCYALLPEVSRSHRPDLEQARRSVGSLAGECTCAPCDK